MTRQTGKQWAWVLGGIALSLTGFPVMALVSSVGEDGIDALRLHQPPYNLTGRKIAIGQVEIGRPAQFGLDKAGATNRSVRPGRLFFRDAPAQANDLVDEHAASVASIMVSNDKTLTGVAPDAVLYSSAVGIEERSEQPEECLAAQTVALQNGGDVRAINYSFGESLLQDPRPDPVLDGNALLTQCIDWSARVYNVLHVISGNQGRGGFPIPTDTFNGIVVSNSMEVNGIFTKVDFFSLGSDPTVVIGRDPETESNVGPRRSVALIAPGTDIETVTTDGRESPPASGTSFAAPHVVATVALLQEYGDRSIRQALEQPSSQPSRWTLDARRQEVMKAVLLNSADKIRDPGDGFFLRMTRTMLDLQNRSWLDSDAYQDAEIPLDAQMGTGHLNAFRAYEQFSMGQWNPEAPVAAIGWDYRTVGASRSSDAPRYQEYVIEQPLQGGSFISVTLAWNRLVELQDDNGNAQYDLGESFVDLGLNDLDIYLMPVDEDDTDDAIWSSVSRVDSVEHIFNQIPQTGQYKIRVVFHDQVNEEIQDYAIAWWALPASP
ncbi:MAG: S8 family serine peptidase [Cyanobacteria bacterium CRU_2_1]|nr:S8 family serine peptidase [Cyanobacteria bacterium RU_5_0]NJR58619.1 S8 family serine peptidase [Cyanobacteria bacterium CRU_2_1]